MPFISFFLNECSVRTWFLCWVEVVRRGTLVILSPLSMMWTVGLSDLWSFLCGSAFFLDTLGGEVLWWKDAEFCYMLFLYLLKWPYHVFIFHFINGSITLIDLHVLNHPLILGWIPPVMVDVPFNVLSNAICLDFVENFCICIYQGFWPVVLFVFFQCPYLNLIWGNAGLIKWVWEYSLFSFLKEFKDLITVKGFNYFGRIW